MDTQVTGSGQGADGSTRDAVWGETSQTTSGSGTATDPSIVTTTLYTNTDGNASYSPATDAQVVVETIYVEPNPYFTQRVTVTPPTGNTDFIKYYHGIDTFLSGGDNGPAFSLPQNLAQTNDPGGDPTLVAVRKDPGGPNDSFFGFAESQTSVDFAHWYSATWAFNEIGGGGVINGTDIVNTWDTNTSVDNEIAIQVDLGAITTPQTFEYHLAYSGEATIDLDYDDSTAPGNDYLTSYVVESGQTVSVSDTDAQIRNVVGDIQELRITANNPMAGDTLTVDVGSLPAGIQVQSQTATEVILEAISTPQTEATFDTALAAVGFTSTSTDLTPRTFEFAVTNELGEEGRASAGTIEMLMDKDGDGVSDVDDVDDDNDGILDTEEMLELSDPAAAPTPDGTEDSSFSTGYWTVSYYEGHHGLPGTSFPNPANGSGAAGSPTFHGTAYVGFGQDTSAFAANGSEANGAWSNTETPTDNASGPPPGYVGTTWSGSNPFYEIVHRRTLTDAGTLTFGGDADDYFDDNVQVIVNGAIAYNGGSGAPDPRPSTGNPVVINLAAGDEVEVRYVNLGFIGGYEFTLETPNDTVTHAPFDSDGDGIFDHLDLDSDNDGITDNIEAQSTAGYVAPSGIDANVDGLDDAYDNRGSNVANAPATTADVTAPVGTDADIVPDYLDTDSDNDGVPDVEEAGHGITQAAIDAHNDADGDGLMDEVDAVDNTTTWDVNDDDFDGTDLTLDDSDADVVSGGANADGLNSDYDWRELPDKDGDQVNDRDDVDDDNDGILDTEESPAVLGVIDAGSSGTPNLTGDFTNSLAVEMPFSVTGSDPSLNFISTMTGVTEGLQFRWVQPNSLSDFDVDLTLQQPVNGILESIRVGNNAPGSTQVFANAPKDMTISWPGGASAILSDPDGNITSHPDGAIITSGTTLTAAGISVDLSTWYMDISLAGVSAPVTINYETTTTHPVLGNEGFAFLPVVSTDTDGDGIANHCDLDSDNDGISDLVEGGAPQVAIDADTNNDGTISLAESAAAVGGTGDDVDGDGLMDVFTATTGTPPRQSDADGLADFLDLDSDADTIPDATEARASVDYVAYAGSGDAADSDDDGILDIYDTATGEFGFATGESNDAFVAGANTANADADDTADTTPDYLDDDSDGDGALDSAEAGAITTAPTYADPDGSVNDPLGSSDGLQNTDNDPRDVDFRSVTLPDKDGDGIADLFDVDDDNDGILDTVESPAVAGAITAGDGTTNPTGTFTNDLGVSMPFALVSDQLVSEHVSGSDSGLQMIWNQGAATTAFVDLTLQQPVDGTLTGIRVGNGAPGNNYGALNIEKHITITWPGGGTAVLVDPLGEINSHADGAVISSGDVVTGGGNIAIRDSEWYLDIDLTGTTAPVTISYSSTVAVSGAILNEGFAFNPVVTTDTDGDGIANHCDLDSDNDGISDLVESGAPQTAIDADTNNDGTISLVESAAAVGSGTGDDVDGDGLMDVFTATTGTPPLQTDADGVADFLDLDSDADTIPDATEARASVDYVAYAGSGDAADSDDDGILDIYDTATGEFGFATGESNDAFVAGANTANADADDTADTTPDYLDDDSDGDGALDSAEAGAITTAPTYADPDGSVNDPLGSSDGLQNTDNDPRDVDFRSVTLPDKDGDGIADLFDVDDDNDGILDSVENSFDPVTLNFDAFTYESGDGDDFSTGDVYRFANVATGVDALLTLNSVDTTIIDGFSFSTTGGEIRFRMPTFAGPTGTGLVDFNLTFVETGTSNPTELEFSVHAFDMDQAGATSDILAIDTSAIGSYTVNNPTQLDINATTSPGKTAFVGTAPDVTDVDPEFLAQATIQSTDSIDLTVGTSSDGTARTRVVQVGFDPTNATFTSADTTILNAKDTDNDGIPDHCDLDSDNDGITDNVEAQSTAGYVEPSGVDANSDGLDDAYDNRTVTGATAAATTSDVDAPVDTDSDGTADYVDTDSDNDGTPDVEEAGHGISQATIDAHNDADGDGLMDEVDAVDNATTWDVNDDDLDPTDTNFALSDSNDNVAADGSDAVVGVNDLDFREDQPPVVDLNSVATGADTDVDFASTFTEGGGAVSVADVDAGTTDFGEDDILELSIVVDPGTVSDGANEIVTVNGVSIPLDANSSNTATSVGGVPVTIAYNATTGEITIVPTDGTTPLDDAALAAVIAGTTYENTDPTPTTGDRTLTFTLTDDGGNTSAPAESTVTVATDTASADWSISGPTSVDEGGSSTYTVTLDNALLQSGETATVDLAIGDVSTTSSDYADFDAAVTAAVNAYNSGSDPGTVSWDGTTLTFASDGTGAMGDLDIVLAATDDAIVEGPEDYTVSLANPTSTTGETIGLDAANSITTTIDDTQGDGGAADGPAEWSITGPTDSDEGSTPQYTVALSGTFGAGEVVTVDLGLTDIDTNSSDYADIVAAITAAAAANPDVTFDSVNGTLTYTSPSDGASMTDLVIDLSLTDDGLIEGPEDFSLGLTNPTTSTGANVAVDAVADSVTTTINDTQGDGGAADGPAEWSITGPTDSDEGTTPQYTVALSGTFGAGEVVTVDLGLTDIDTNSSDYADVVAAITAAATANPDVTFDSVNGTLTYTSPSDGASMTDLVIDLSLTDDGLIEGPEDFSLGLTNPTTSTGANVAVDAAADSVTTTINDTQGDGGSADGPAEWSITGPTDSDEGSTPQYTVALSGTFGAGEVVTVDLGLTDVDTNSSDYADVVAAITAAAAANPDVTFDSVNGTLTYTSPSDGASMTDLVIDLPLTDDGLIEGPEDFSLGLTNPMTSTGANVAVDAAADSVTTTINDTQGDGGAADGPAEWSITGPTDSDEGSTPQYTVALSGTFGAGEVVTVDLGLTDVDTNSSDYADVVAAITAAATANPDVTFDSVNGTLTYTSPSDGASMTDLVIDLPLTDDGLIEGPEDFSLGLTNPTTSTGANVAVDAAAASVTTTINDTQGDGGAADGPAEWSITGPTDSDEGSTPQYTVALSGTYQAGEVVTVDLGLTDIDTNSSDYADVVAAITAAAAANPDVTFDSVNGTLTYTSPSDGASMTDLVVDLPLTDDGLIEGPEDFSLGLTNPTSSTGVPIAVDAGAATTTTTINDTQGDGGIPDGPAEWSVTGPAMEAEGNNAAYTVSLGGTFQAGEVVSVDIGLTDIDTSSGDYADVVAAVTAAAAANPDVTFDSVNGTLTYTAPSDGATMTPLAISLGIVDDGLAEPPEDFQLGLSNPVSGTGVIPTINATAGVVTTTINGSPVPENDIQTTIVDTPVDGNVMSNDFDPDGDAISVSEVNGTPIGAPIPTANGGTVDMNPDGTYTYTPAPGFVGEDTFEYEVCDTFGNCELADVTIDVTDPAIDPLNTPPIAGDDHFEGFTDQPITSTLVGNDSDPDGDVIAPVDPATGEAATGTITVPTAQGGSVDINPDGTFTYTPAPGFEGEDTFDYSVIDPSGTTDDATVTLSVGPDPDPLANDAPDANDDQNTTQPNTPASGNVLDNDTDPNGDTPLTVTEIDGTPVVAGTPTTITLPSGSTVEINDDGSYVYTPADGVVGTESLPYTVDDGNGGTDTATLILTVVDSPPVVEDDINQTPVDTPVDGNVLTNDSSDPMDDLVIGDGSGTPITGPTALPTANGGSVDINPDGSYTYTPAPGFVGEDTITLEVCDEAGNCENNLLTIEVVDPAANPVNTPPVAQHDYFESHVNTQLVGDVSGNDGDPDGDATTVVDPLTGEAATGVFTIATTQGGSVDINPDGTFTYTPPAADFIGEDTFDYTIIDPSGATDDATASITVAADSDPLANDDPDANDDVAITQKNTPVDGNALDNDTDPNGDAPLAITDIDGTPVVAGTPTTVTLPTGSTVEINDDGTYTYSPADDFVGTEAVTYTIDDGNGGTDTATIYLSVFDTPPEVEDDINITSVDTQVDGNVLTNDTSEPNDDLVMGDSLGNPLGSPQIVVTANGGQVLVQPNGDYTYTPPAGFVGEDSATLHVCDEAGNCLPNELTIEVIDTSDDPLNTPPIAEDDFFEVFENTMLSSDLTGNDGDPDGDVIAVVDPATGEEATAPVTITTAQGGSVDINPDGTFDYTPPLNFTGEDTFDYTIIDPSGATDDATATITVGADPDPLTNDDPDANDDSATTPMDTLVSGNVLDNDTDPNGVAPLTVTEIDGTPVVAGTPTTVMTANGSTIAINDDGSYTYTPAAGFIGTETVTYSIDDGNGGTDAATIYLATFDSPPNVEDDINTTVVNVPVDGDVTTNDDGGTPGEPVMMGDAFGNPLAAPTPMPTDQGGQILVSPDGTYTYTPPTDFVGEDTVTLHVCDAGGTCLENELVIDVVDVTADPLNTPPIANDDHFEGFVDQQIGSALGANDSDPDGDVLAPVDPATGNAATATITVPTTAGGTVDIDPDGTFTYTPPAGFVGEDTFDYSVIDPSGATDDATVTLTVTGDPDPTANDAPDANDDQNTTLPNTTASGNVLDNDTDPNGDTPLTVTDIDGTPVVPGTPTTLTLPSGSTVEINDDGTYTYSPADGVLGTESVEYTIDDGNGGTDTATLYLTVVDSPPVVEDDINQTSVDTPVDGNMLTNDSSDPMDDLVVGDGGGSPITGPTTLTTANGGSVEINPDGSYTYTPAQGFVGEDTITLEVCDEAGNCEPNELVIDVVDSSDPVNTPPVAGDDHLEPTTDTPFTSTLAGNDGDPDAGDSITVVDPATGIAATGVVTVPTAAGGSVDINPDGTFTYTPPAGFVGEDTFDYSVIDTMGATDDATVTLIVTPDPDPNANDEPDANDDAAVTEVGTAVSGDVLENDTDPNGDPLTVTEIDGTPVVPGTPTTITTPSGGTLTINDDGTYDYSPADGFVGTEPITYMIADGNGGTDAATLYLAVHPTPPNVEDDISATTVDTPVDGNIMTNDASDAGFPLTVGDGSGSPITGTTSFPTTNGGTVDINPDGSYTYTPAPGFVGEDTVTLEVCDPTGACLPNELVIDVIDPADDPLNTPPIAGDDHFEGFVDTPISSTLGGNDSDPDGDVIAPVDPATGEAATGTITVPTTAGGSVDINSDGTFTYTPPPGFQGEDAFDYSVIDPAGETDDATVTLNVGPDPDPAANNDPDANDDATTTLPNSPASGNVLSNDTDPNGDPLTVTDLDGTPVVAGTPTTVVLPSGSTVEIADDGTYTYMPAPGVTGTESIPYTIDDGAGGTDTATLYLTVVDNPPLVEDDINNTSMDTPVDGNVLTNDESDPGDPLSIGDGSGTPIAPGTTMPTDQGGTLEIDPDGSYTYTPAPGFVGEDTITLEVCDSAGNCEENELVIDVVDPTADPDNTPPIAGDDFFEPTMDTPFTSSLAGNDGDPDGDVIAPVDPTTGTAATATVTIPTTAGGSVDINPDGTFTYTPPAGFTGEDTFDYSVIDPSGETDDATVTLQVTADPDPAANDAPGATDDAAITQLNTPVVGEVLINDTDPNGDAPLAVTDIDGTPVVPGTPTTVTLPSGSTVEINDDGTYTYTPADGFTGTEDVTYTIDDGNGGTDTATLYLSVFDLPPQAEDDINTTTIDTPVTGDILTNDTSEPNDDLTVGDGNGNPLAGPLTLPTDQGGTIEINPDGTYEYTPPAGFVGSDSVTLEVCDEAGNCVTEELDVTVVEPAQNTPPIAEDDNFETFSDPVAPVTLSGNVFGNDGDPDADVIAVTDIDGTPVVPGTPTTVTTANGGTVTINDDGTFDYGPAPGFIGNDTFDYTIADPSGETDTATVSIDVQPDPDPATNDDPDANDDGAITPKNLPVSGNALDNDTDPNNDAPLTVTDIDGTPVVPGTPTVVTLPSGSTVEIADDGTYTYTPANDFVGTESVVYSIDDGNGGTDTATIVLSTFDGPPVAEDDFITTDSGQPVDGNLTVNDSDPNDDDLTVATIDGTPVTGTTPVTIPVDDPANPGTPVGDLTVDPVTGDYTFTPTDPDFTGDIVVPYEAADESGNTDPAVLTIHVVDTDPPVDPADPSTFDNAPPIATDDEFSAQLDTPLSSSVMSNDSDPDGDTITIADPVTGDPATAPQTFPTTQGGSVTLNPDGTFDYTPPADYLGTDTFDYTIVDPSGATDTATVTIDVEADPDPAANDQPEAGDDLITSTVGDPATGNMLDNDTDPNSDPLTITEVDGQDPAAGPITLTDPVTAAPLGVLDVDPTTGEVTFTPEPAFVGTIEFPYTIDDGNGGTDDASLTITVFDEGPEATDDINATEIDTPVSGDVTLNDSDTNPNDTLTIVDPATGDPATGPLTVTTPNGGTVVFEPDGTYEYTPAPGFVGEDTFDYTIVDGFGKDDMATVSIEVRDTVAPDDPADPTTFNNAPPTATDDEFTVTTDQPLTSDVMSNDGDPDGDFISIADPATGEPATAPQTFPTDQGGTVTIAPDGTFAYTPPAGFIGEDSFDYTIVDPSGATDVGVVTLEVTPDDPATNDPPTGGDDLLVGTKNEPTSANLTANDSDPEVDPLTVTDINGTPVDPVLPTTVTLPEGALEYDPATGDITFTPTDDFVGTVQVPYETCDPAGNCDTAVITATVYDTAPEVIDDINNTPTNTPVDGNVLDNDNGGNPDDDVYVSDPSGNPIAPGTLIPTTEGGQISINPDGSYTYTPATDFSGQDTVIVTVCDEAGNCEESEIVIDVVDTASDPNNTPPIAGDDNFEVFTDTPLTSSLDGNDGDPDGDPVTVVDPATSDPATGQVTVPTTAGGTVTIAPDGTFTYTPPAGFIGEDSFDYTIIDPNGATDTGSVTINVEPDANPGGDVPPDANDDVRVTPENVPIGGNALGNDTDPRARGLSVIEIDGQPVVPGTPTVITLPSGGTLSLDSNGDFFYTPINDFVGTESVPYTIEHNGVSSLSVNGGVTNMASATIFLSTYGHPYVSAEKLPVSIVPASSLVQGNFDVTYQFTLGNTGTTPLDNLTLVDDLVSSFGGGFQGIVNAPTITFSDATDDPGINSNFDGGVTDSNIFDSSPALLEELQQIVVVFTAEIDPDAPDAVFDSVTGDGTGDLENQALVTATDPLTGDPTFDTTDDPTDPTDDDGDRSDPSDDNGDPDDVTGLFLPSMFVEKAQVGVAIPTVNGTAGNIDLVYDFTITNTGNDRLTNLSLTEDLSTQFGGAFVQINLGPTIVASTASDNPEFNAAFDGGMTDAEIIDNTGLNTNQLAPGESVTIRIGVEVNAASPTTNWVNGFLSNSATASATPVRAGGSLSTTSDDPADTTNQDTDGDNNPDDPTLTALTSEISGSVYSDSNGNGVFDPGESGILGVELILSGTDIGGNPVNVSVLAGADGAYTFEDVFPGGYTITQIHPPQFIDGTDSAGTLGGTVSDDQIAVTIPPGADDAFEYNFGEAGLRPEFISKAILLASTPDNYWASINASGSGTLGVWVPFDATEGGAVNAVLANADGVQVDIFDSEMNPLNPARETADDSTWVVHEGEQYFARLTGDDSDFDFGLDFGRDAGLEVTVEIEDNVAMVVATIGDDDVELVLGAQTHILTMADFEFEFDATVVDTIHIGGGQGWNAITVHGTDLDDVGDVLDRNGRLISDAYTIGTWGFDETTLVGGGGYDYSQIYGSTGADNLQALPQDSTITMENGGITKALEFERVDSYGRGGLDYGSMYGTNESDEYYTFDTYEVLRSIDGNMVMRTIGWDRVDAFGRHGDDVAYVYDTPGDDHFWSFGQYFTMVSDHLLTAVKGFEQVQAEANEGGTDTFHIRQIAATDSVSRQHDRVTIEGPTRNVQTSGFEEIDEEDAIQESSVRQQNVVEPVVEQPKLGLNYFFASSKDSEQQDEDERAQQTLSNEQAIDLLMADFGPGPDQA